MRRRVIAPGLLLVPILALSVQAISCLSCMAASDRPTPSRSFSWWYHAASTSTNVTAALALLRSAGGRAVASSWLVYCGDTVANGTLAFGSPPACATLGPALAAMGVAYERVVGHVDDLADFRALLASESAPGAFAGLVRAHGLAGVSFDMEPPDMTEDDAVRYGAFLARVAAALAPLGARVTVYAYSAHHSAIANFSALARGAARLLDGDTYSGPDWDGWLSRYERLVPPAPNATGGAGVPLAKAGPAMMISTERGNWTCEPGAIAQRMARIAADGVPEVAAFAFDPAPSTACHFSRKYNRTVCPCTRAWLPAARSFLALGGDDWGR